MMKLMEAISASMDGATIVSNVGKRYTPAELSAKRLGRQAVVYRTCGMSEQERKGRWDVA